MKKNFRVWIYSLVVIGTFLIFSSSCKKGDDPTAPVPVLTTSEVWNITSSTASCGGIIISDGGSTITARGVCWSTGTTPTIADSKTTDGSGAGTFSSSITGLTGGINGTMYYVRAYATTNAGTGYGSAMSFTTKPGGVSAGMVTDIDGNVYQTIIIGTQVWMVENLKTTKYRDGSPIPNVTDNTWGNLTTGAYCNYNNDAAMGTKYGKLYNWYAVNDSRKIAPTGWHVASDAEWTTLVNYVGTNIETSGFIALLGGFRDSSGSFDYVETLGNWWSSTEVSWGSAWYWGLDLYINYVINDHSYESCGFSVRCVRDL